MSTINSTGLYGDSYLFEDVEQLKIDVTTLTTDHLSTKTEHDGRLDLLEIDNTRKQYNLNFVKYEIFIEGLLNLMKRLNERYDNENFEILLNFIDINKKLLLVDNIKTFIETELLTVYNKFKI